MENILTIKLPASNGEAISLEQFLGRNIVLYFYPKDMTPGCTTEACDFGESHLQFSEYNTVVIGVSTDSISRHQKFIEKHQLPFLLLADEEHQLAEAFAVWKPKKFMGREFLGIVRSTFLLNKQGEIIREWRNVRVKGHVAEVLQAVVEIEN